jgi:hypothetical protein
MCFTFSELQKCNGKTDYTRKLSTQVQWKGNKIMTQKESDKHTKETTITIIPKKGRRIYQEKSTAITADFVLNHYEQKIIFNVI